MSGETVLLVVIDTARGGTAKRWINIPAFMVKSGLDNPALMSRAEREAADIGVVRSIELVHAKPDQKLIRWDKP